METFLKAIVKSGLLDAAQMQAVRDAAPPEARNDARALADHLVKTGKLTRFQAGKLLKGISLGLVFGPYHILSPLGKGGMGSVFLARDSRSQLLVAVKVLPPKQAKGKERLVARFRREMELCRRVAHPNVTRTLEVGEQMGINFIAMEFIPGRDLYHLVRERGPLHVERAARLFSEVAAGLEHAHTMGLIHRDMKPSNIMVLPDDHAKILDLGLALMEREGDKEPTVLASGQGVLVGTPDYMAPEQGEDPLKVDTRSDIYALGCTLYYTLTGQVPFPGGGALQKMLRHKCDPPVPISKLNPKVPTAFTALVTQMMAKQPDLRYQSASEVREVMLKWCGEAGKADGDGRGASKPLAEVKPLDAKPAEAAPLAVLVGNATAPSPAPPAALVVAPPPTAKLAPSPALKPPASAPPPSPAPVPVPAAQASPPIKSMPAASSPPAPAASAPASPAARLAPAQQFPPPIPATPPAPPSPVNQAPPPPEPVRPPAPAAADAARSPRPSPPMPRRADTGRIPKATENGAAAAEPAVPSAASPAPGLPFLIDFVIPVVIGSLFLVTLWILGLMLLIRSGGQ